MKLVIFSVVLCTLFCISFQEPCSTKTPDCVPTAEHAEPGAQFKAVGLWIVGPKKGPVLGSRRINSPIVPKSVEMKSILLLVLLGAIVSISVAKPCSIKILKCLDTPLYSDDGQKPLGVWIVGPKKGEVIYDLDEVEQQRDLLAEIRRNGALVGELS
ncbi:hypothetical protein CpipJ_CPIJ011436 [Culex quinquefasciatus]|uniref:Uncharacterized protein n=1 Tax=Culex quinquefasciatus TaxID=7176 RepID=B0WVQ9_CULQU|nr:hypothetical protein CpipJ_CPIJ011436 [Culex quinquefasciatus]|eukprot:XP_001861481.1 hypothetical protein CpipJ_CPIJ011436 [Culex quinquefasciatus]